MRSRLPSWVLLLNLAIDFAIFFVPGAFRLSPGTGLVWAEGIFRSREGASAGTSEERGAAPPPRPSASTLIQREGGHRWPI